VTFPEHRSTPVVVLDCRRQGGLGIVRSLGRLGIPVWGVAANKLAPPFFSRYQKGGFHWNIDVDNASGSLAFLCRAAEKIGGKAILIPTTDDGALFVSDHASTLERHFLFHAVPPSLVHRLCSKSDMFFLAKEHSIPTANSVFPLCRQDVV